MKTFFRLTFAILIMFWAGCTNPFSTRSPETPDLGSGTGISDNSLQNDASGVLIKVQQAFTFKDARAYRDCFAEQEAVGNGYTFTPENAETPRLAGWSVQDEENYFLNLTSDADVRIDYSPESPIPTPVLTSTDTMQLDFDYRITAQFRTKTERYQGRSVISVFKASDERWYIFSWRDLEQTTGSATDSTWSTLKANYRIASSK